jgi:hypothetical protein
VVSLNFTLQDKSITLKEVKIGDSSGRAKMLQTFKTKFLGFTTNGLSCKILNTELLEFTTAGSVLSATSSDFLIIENFGLGYRIKYLLKNFSFNSATHITAYDGDCILKNCPVPKAACCNGPKTGRRLMKPLLCITCGVCTTAV